MDIKAYIESKGNEVTQGYGHTDFAQNRPQIYGKDGFHNGIDYVPKGNKIRALFPGRVEHIGYGSDLGNYVLVEDDFGYSVYYTHLDEDLAKIDERILVGSLIGEVGQTGLASGEHNHLMVKDPDGNVIDPNDYYQKYVAEQGKQDNKEHMDLDQYIDGAYQQILGRPADEEGKEYYKKRVENGKMEWDEILGALLYSREFEDQRLQPKVREGRKDGK